MADSPPIHLLESPMHTTDPMNRSTQAEHSRLDAPRLRPVVGLLAGLLLFGVGCDPDNDDFAVNSWAGDPDISVGAHSPELVVDPATGQVLVAFDGTVGFESRVYLRTLGDPDGPTAPETELSSLTAEPIPSDISIVRNPQSGQSLVTWSEAPPQLESQTVYAQLVAPDGSPVGAPATIASSDHPHSRRGLQTLALYLPTPDEYLVIWQDRVDSSTRFFRARRVSLAGVPLGDAYSLAAIDDASGASPADVTYAAALDEHLITFARATNQPFQSEIAVQRVDSATGLAIGPASGISDDLSRLESSVAFNSIANEYLVVWSNFQTSDLQITGQRLDASAAEIGGDFAITQDAGLKANPDLRFDAGLQGFVMAFEAASPPGSPRQGIELQLLDASGQATCSAAQVLSDLGAFGGPLRPYYAPRIASIGNGRYVGVWEGHARPRGAGDPNGFPDLYGSFFDPVCGS